MMYMFYLYHFSLKCIIKNIIYHATIPLKCRQWINDPVSRYYSPICVRKNKYTEINQTVTNKCKMLGHFPHSCCQQLYRKVIWLATSHCTRLEWPVRKVLWLATSHCTQLEWPVRKVLWLATSHCTRLEWPVRKILWFVTSHCTWLEWPIRKVLWLATSHCTWLEWPVIQNITR